jgi:ribosomal protein S18 acetylase RimI-like enzyme
MLEIREATEADLPEIVRLLAEDPLGAQRERFEEPLPQAYRDAFARMRRQPGNRILLAVADGAVAGCLQLTTIAGLSRQGLTRAQIEGVRVAKDRRGLRIGEALMRHAIALARAEGCGLVQLTTDRRRSEAHRFYERLGFVASHLGMKLEIGPERTDER